MSKYDFNNIEFSMAVSNIKSSLYDVISSINGNIFSITEELNEENDEQKSALKNKLEIELKKLISLSDQVEKTISSVDRILSDNDLDVNNEVEVNTDDNSENDINLDSKQIIPDQIDTDEEVELSDKAINDLYKEENNNTETEETTSEENSEVKEAVPDVNEETVSEEKSEAEDAVPEVKEEAPEEKPVIEIPVGDSSSEENSVAAEETVSEEKTEVEEPSSDENASEENEINPVIEAAGLKLPGLENNSNSDEETPVEETTSEVKEEEPTVELPVSDSLSEENNTEEDTTTTEVKEEPVEEPNIEVPVVESTEEAKEEKPTLDTLPVEEDNKESNNNSNINYMVSKTTNDPSKAIIVTDGQFKKLLASHDTQRSLSKFRNLFKLDNVQHDDINLEEMMNKANELYKSGDVKGAEELYNKISEINESRNS